ncbi:glycosyltransferase family 9 protein [Hymenobacter aerilatus]|uniref:Glycosyltransferase family 9 protein n=1 Tax=Hymenobacter aerilatus TaxID=2932251 RepID=A0A8T9SUN1_9BACT|nr:glycosyltransferase family 9 protein [Hymenobacter aerilatus]UOR05585.1 glycosyltransferase family 9 protein [Hymenobacter aerilatus]
MLTTRPTLLIQTGSLTDVILLTALIEQLRIVDPTSVLDVLIQQEHSSILQNHPSINQIITVEKPQIKLPVAHQLLRQIRAANYHRVINLQSSTATGLLTAFSGAEERIGFTKNPLSTGFTRSATYFIASDTHEVARNMQLLALPDYTPLTLPRLYPTFADMEAVMPYKLVGDYLCLAPGADQRTRQLPTEQWLKLLAVLPARYTVYLVGTSADAAVCAELATRSHRSGVVNLAGQLSVLATAALLRGAVLNYVLDSAMLHLCSAVAAPTCAVYCSTSPTFGFGPLSPQAWIVETAASLECRSCDVTGYAQCPLTHFLCGRGIGTAQLLAPLAEAEQLQRLAAPPKEVYRELMRA